MEGNVVASKGFLGSLFDLSFNHLIATKAIKVVYVLGMIVIGLGWLAAVVAGFTQGAGDGLIALVLGGLVALLYLISIRIWLEIIIAVFKIVQNTRETADNTRAIAQGRSATPDAG
ncbi:MAG: DUF4282 domain-containing protein [Solirubrobacterales bacterium]|nr:DUF4282 domain-containing protein [Solirubrobacterales bacterium]